MNKSTAIEKKGKPVKENTRDLFQSLYWPVLCVVCAVISESLLRSFLSSPSAVDGIGRMAIIFMGLYIIHRFALLSLNDYRDRFKDMIFLATVLIGQVFIVSAGRVLIISLSSYVGEITLPGLSGVVIAPSAGSMYYAVPYAAGGILILSVLGIQYGLVFGLYLALILSLYTPMSLMITPFVLATTFIGCFSMIKFRSRSAYIKAGLNVSLIAIPFALCSVLIVDDISAANIAIRVLAAFAGGIFCGFVVGGLTPVLEYLGGYVTDISLLEMATLDHPLLKEVSIQAPGTWNHSMVMGMMAEAAAAKIGANPILARVGAYFHDIGKTKNPLYFVENQVKGENRHDKLSSSMSALIIKSHVKDGIKLARQHKLPQAIVDMIPQHHGTSVIGFFYDKACKEAEEAGEDVEVEKSAYCYPGPKPQTREAGILMLADGVEAAARTLSEPSHDRIQGLVQKMINKVFASGQLNECELTLKDLNSIAKSFTRVLNSIYHQRIAYSEPAEKVSEKEGAASAAAGREGEAAVGGKKGANGKKDGNSKGKMAGISPESKPGDQGERKRDKKDREEDLKRLGMS